MTEEIANHLLDGHAAWWRSQFSVCTVNGGVQVISPMIDRHNDHIGFYLSDDARLSGGYVLTDLGATLEDLAASGCDVLRAPARVEKLDQTLRGFGLERKGVEIFVRSGASGLPRAMSFIMQGLSTIDDLFFTARGNVRSYLREDVEVWLDASEIRYAPDISIAGRSGFETKFDFLIPKTGHIAPERFIKVVSNPSRQSVGNSLFGWGDINAAREGSELYLFMDVRNTRSGQIGTDLMQACHAYDVQPVSWDGTVDEAIASEMRA